MNIVVADGRDVRLITDCAENNGYYNIILCFLLVVLPVRALEAENKRIDDFGITSYSCIIKSIVIIMHYLQVAATAQC